MSLGRSGGPLALTAVAVAVLTAAVFLARAGGDPGDAATWPISWELRSSDNGTLFQFWGDVAAGRPLDWSFSPQVFVFPELPLSGIAFLVAGGGVYGYYLAVAVLNQVVLFLLLAALARVLWPLASSGTAALRAAVATVPFLLIPLVGTSWVMSFHLAPTYYFGMYAALLAGPLLFLARTRAVRVAIGLGLALTVASNPLTLLFAAPGLLAVVVAAIARSGWRAQRSSAAWLGGTVVVAAVARLAMTPLQGTGLFTYMDLEVFRGRLGQLEPYWSFQLRDPAAALILPLGALLAVACLAGAIAAWVRLGRRLTDDEAAYALSAVFLGLVPLGGLAATVLALITHYYYFWPALILPFALVAFAIPRRALRYAAVAGAASLVVVGIATGGVANLAHLDRYAGYRSAETRCLDESVPGEVGFATFSDARRLSLTSATGVRLIPVTADLNPNLWLTNRAYSRLEHGTFLYVNLHGDERALDGDAMRRMFGAPDSEVECADGQRLWIYDHPLSVAGGG